MKAIGLILLLALNNNLLSQDRQDDKMFSKFNLSFSGGVNFSKNSSVGGSFQFAGKTDISSRVNIKLSLGYSLVKENADYTVYTYDYAVIDNIEGYELEVFNINQIQYSIIPINLGLEYTLSENIFSPYVLIEAGYNFYTTEEQVASSGSIGWVETKDEIPVEHRNAVPNAFDDSCYGLGAGIGISYKISQSFALEMIYVYRYYDKIINSHQLLFGVTI